MNLYLVRHAHAVPRETPGVETEADRPLSGEGIQQVKWLASGLKKLGVVFDQFVTSPLLRTRQTAEELQREMGTSTALLVDSKALAPGGSSKKLAKFLMGLEGDHVVLVGHEPDLGQHAAWLIGGKNAQIDFSKGSAACIVCDRSPAKGAGALAWLIPAEAFRPE